MAIVKNIGKNTIGDNKKMAVSMHEYHMSSQNLSEVFRSTLGVGMLVPCYNLLCQKGDVVDIQMINKTLTHPTLGPLFGSFKLQHFMFFGPLRLYNSWLHNNRNGIGMKMSDIKFPKAQLAPTLMPGTQTYQIKTNSSSLYNYLGWKGSIYKNSTAPSGILKNGIKQLIYWDCFKNYFANTQEKNFYMIKKTNFVEKLRVQGVEGIYFYQNGKTQRQLINSASVIWLPVNQTNNNTFWSKVTITYAPQDDQTNEQTRKITEIGTVNTGYTQNLLLDKLVGTNVLIRLNWENTDKAIELKAYPLETLDLIRDEILARAGNTSYYIDNNASLHSENVLNFYKDTQNSQTSKLGGLLLKTYDSDIFQNWIKTEWIDGPNGISEITAIDVSGGKLSLDALNLQQKVYNMLNRIAVSGGSYRDWLETMYTAGKYIDRPETPVFIGGMTQYIEFDEVISKSATETSYGSQPLGDLAGRGYAKAPENSGHIHYQCEEPGYIMGLIAITPMLDYSQGNSFDLNLETMDDLHKPALDGIGYQDSLNEQRAWWTAAYTTALPSSIQDTKAGKTVAWIDYMTSYNKTFGNFAAGESEDFMCLNRRYEGENDAAVGQIKDLTTYIDPTKHIEIFADTNLDSQNFWVQTAFQVTRRGNYSAKQIPNL